MREILVVSPHADDETLGCGGTILRHTEEGDRVHWLLVTEMTSAQNFNTERIIARQREIEEVSTRYKFQSVHQLKFSAAALETFPVGDIIRRMSDVIQYIKPEIVYSPYRNDAHSDHQVVFDALMSATKSFRYPFVKRVLCYETLSETDFGLKPEDGGFKANVYVDISPYIDEKLNIMAIFDSEVGEFPFPRSFEAVRALATLRGVQSNCIAAEGFMLVKEII